MASRKQLEVSPAAAEVRRHVSTSFSSWCVWRSCPARSSPGAAAYEALSLCEPSHSIWPARRVQERATVHTSTDRCRCIRR